MTKAEAYALINAWAKTNRSALRQTAAAIAEGVADFAARTGDVRAAMQLDTDDLAETPADPLDLAVAMARKHIPRNARILVPEPSKVADAVAKEMTSITRRAIVRVDRTTMMFRTRVLRRDHDGALSADWVASELARLGPAWRAVTAEEISHALRDASSPAAPRCEERA